MEVVYKKVKQYPDGSETVIFKNGVVSNNKVKSERKKYINRKINRIKKENRRKELIKKYNEINGLFIDDSTKRELHLIDLQLSQVDMDSKRRSAQRSFNELYDICKCNEFQYFVTVTFDDREIDSYDDTKTRKAFSNFMFYLRTKYPQLFYVCVPEYQKRGALHFHMLVGGMTMQELGCVPAINQDKDSKYYGQPIFKNGKQIFNVTVWKKGYSTLSEIGSLRATRRYICKYITKQYGDERLFGKKRYYVSQNIQRPVIIKEILQRGDSQAWQVNPTTHYITYASEFRQYAVFDSIPCKHAHLFGFFEDCKDAKPQGAKIGVKQGIQETMRKSLLEKLQGLNMPSKLNEVSDPRRMANCVQCISELNQKGVEDYRSTKAYYDLLWCSAEHCADKKMRSEDENALITLTFNNPEYAREKLESIGLE